MSMKDDLVRICLDSPLQSTAVVQRPFIPWVPEDWSGLLVLAEAQNLSDTNSSYRDQLQAMSDERQVGRLYEFDAPNDLGIEPWDDGSLKLAVEAALVESWSRTAVSNAVLWSQVTVTRANQTPSDELIDVSSKLWSQMLAVLQPKSVLSAGKIARRVVDAAKQPSGCSFEHIKLRLPSKNAMSRVSGMFDKDDLKDRYPEVAEIVNRKPDWLGKPDCNKIFFACHAVSLYGRQLGIPKRESS